MSDLDKAQEEALELEKQEKRRRLESARAAVVRLMCDQLVATADFERKKRNIVVTQILPLSAELGIKETDPTDDEMRIIHEVAIELGHDPDLSGTNFKFYWHHDVVTHPEPERPVKEPPYLPGDSHL